MLTELGCVVYAGIRYEEYIESKTANYQGGCASLTFPNDLFDLSDIQKNCCKQLINANKSLIRDTEKIYIQYCSFPDNVYTKEQILENFEMKNKYS